jgi:hypothetical protein
MSMVEWMNGLPTNSLWSMFKVANPGQTKLRKYINSFMAWFVEDVVVSLIRVACGML